MDDVFGFLMEWFIGPLGIRGIVREIGVCVGDMDRCAFQRGGFTAEGLQLLWREELLKLFKRTNIFMGIGFWVDPFVDTLEQDRMLYDRLSYDFDSEENPELAVNIALGFANTLVENYGTTPIVFRTGFKGARVVVPVSKPMNWEGYQLLWRHLLKLVPKEHRSLVDRNMLQWNRLDRVPLTWNIKEGKKALARIVYPREYTYEDFSWSTLQHLDPSQVTVEKFKLPEVPRPRMATKRAGKWRWVKEIVKRGLPDGRKRFILYVLSPYLANILGVDEETYVSVVKTFIENSCRNWNNCGRIYESWYRSDYRRVKAKGTKPWSLKAVQEKDPELYTIIVGVLK